MPTEEAPQLRLVGLVAAQALPELLEEARGLDAEVFRDEVSRRRPGGLFVLAFFRHVPLGRTLVCRTTCGEREPFPLFGKICAVTRVGLLFPGEMGALVGSAVQGEVLWASEGRSEATRERAAGFTDVGTVRELVAASEIVVSLCPPAIAEDVAGEVAAEGLDGIYVEANAIAPERMERIAGLLRCVDGCVIGRTGVHLYLSGDPDDVGQIAALFGDGDVRAIPLEGGIGAASALKMAFGGWNKIGVALAAQAHAIARAYGVAEALEGEGVESDRVLHAAPKAWRWAPEMEEVAATCAALGLPDGIPLGAADLYSRWDAHRDRPAELDRLLEDLASGTRDIDALDERL